MRIGLFRLILSVFLVITMVFPILNYQVQDVYGEPELLNGLVANYKFEGNAHDVTGKCGYGIEVGEIQYVDGLIGKAVKLDGSSYIEITNNAYINFDGDFTISLWAKPEDLSANQLILLNKEDHYELGIVNDSYNSIPTGDIAFAFNNSWDWYTTGYKPKKDSFFHIAVTYNASEKKVSSYINGVKYGEHQYTSGLSKSDSNLRIGARVKDGSKNFIGVIDELRIYNRCLQVEEISKIYNPKPMIFKGYSIEGKAILEMNQITNYGTKKVKEYKIYRGSASNKQEATPIMTVSGQKPEYPVWRITDQKVEYQDTKVEAGKTYYYVYKVVYEDNTESELSNEVGIYVYYGEMVLEIGNPDMTVDGLLKEIDVGNGTAPLLVNERTLLPIRAIVEEMGGEVFWNEEAQKVTIKIGSKTLSMGINETSANVNGIEKTMDVPPQMINSRTMVPLRFVAENLDCKVDWDADNQKASIKYPSKDIGSSGDKIVRKRLSELDMSTLERNGSWTWIEGKGLKCFPPSRDDGNNFLALINKDEIKSTKNYTIEVEVMVEPLSDYYHEIPKGLYGQFGVFIGSPYTVMRQMHKDRAVGCLGMRYDDRESQRPFEKSRIYKLKYVRKNNIVEGYLDNQSIGTFELKFDANNEDKYIGLASLSGINYFRSFKVTIND